MTNTWPNGKGSSSSTTLEDDNAMDFLGSVYTMDLKVGSWKMVFLHGPT